MYLLRCWLICGFVMCWSFGAGAQDELRSISDSHDYAALEQRIRTLTEESKFSDALQQVEEYKAIVASQDGTESVAYATALSYRGFVQLLSSRFDGAIEDFRLALSLYKAHNGSAKLIANALNNLGQVEQAKGLNEEAERLYSEALALQQTQSKVDDPDFATSLANLAHMRQLRGDAQAAEGLLKRSLIIRKLHYPTNHHIVAATLQNLASAMEAQGRLSEAEVLLRDAIRMRKISQSPLHPQYAGSLHRLGVNLYRQRKHAEAEQFLAEAVTIRRQTSGFRVDLALNLTDLAQILILRKRYDEAEAALQEALNIYRHAVPSSHTYFAEVNRDLAYVADGLGQPDRALELSRMASAVYAERGTRDGSSRVQFQNHVELAWKAYARAGSARADSNMDEAFKAAQRAMITETELSVVQMAARLAVRAPHLKELVRERQDLDSLKLSLEHELIATLAVPDQHARAEELRKRIEAAIERSAEIGRGLDRDFPEYQALLQIQPLSIAEVRSSLGANEALVVVFSTYDQVYVWAVSSEGAVWARSALDAFDVASRVAELRSGLELLRPDAPSNRNKLFDPGKAHELYRALLGPIEHVISGREHLMFVANGAATSLPFHALVTTPPGKARSTADLPRFFARVEWLVRRHSTSVLPSVGSLKSLRRVATSSAARHQLVGFGNPQFAVAAADTADTRSSRAATLGLTRSFASFWRGAAVDVDRLKELPRLPNTEIELKGVASLIAPDDALLFFGADASEEAVKSAKLDDYRIVYFATHALVAGDLARLAEPALALAIPNAAAPNNDGLLTASEVAALKLDADWVILSACNTAAAGKQGAEALSGLAQAFFYAGSRALLVSHWAVDDYAAAAVMVHTFDALAQKPTIGRAGALRSAMLANMADPKRPWAAYPSYWAPFFVVGLNTVAATPAR